MHKYKLRGTNYHPCNVLTKLVVYFNTRRRRDEEATLEAVQVLKTVIGFYSKLETTERN